VVHLDVMTNWSVFFPVSWRDEKAIIPFTWVAAPTNRVLSVNYVEEPH
jgi:hypothetical protein